MQSSMNDEGTSDLSGLALHKPSRDFSGDAHLWDDFLPSEPYFSNPCSQLCEENLWSDESDSAYRMCPVGAGLFISETSLASRSSRDSGFDNEEQVNVTSRDMPPPLTPEPCRGIQELTCHENFIALDHNFDPSLDICTFEEDVDAVMPLD
ncbi:hypothetical protein B0F90DRAFT_1247884 [Multifurca ochricompacta]|uniref:Uncharacterized protein n=1 Tax=Multifurca ochricompacta TaxID=376703 RepID=A0AAD4M708_9AGAM|nr:hypothetical protein B0F90DRAFT_1247884 [Multifurca ochricompacta]